MSEDVCSVMIDSLVFAIKPYLLRYTERGACSLTFSTVFPVELEPMLNLRVSEEGEL